MIDGALPDDDASDNDTADTADEADEADAEGGDTVAQDSSTDSPDGESADVTFTPSVEPAHQSPIDDRTEADSLVLEPDHPLLTDV